MWRKEHWVVSLLGRISRQRIGSKALDSRFFYLTGSFSNVVSVRERGSRWPFKSCKCVSTVVLETLSHAIIKKFPTKQRIYFDRGERTPKKWVVKPNIFCCLFNWFLLKTSSRLSMSRNGFHWFWFLVQLAQFVIWILLKIAFFLSSISSLPLPYLPRDLLIFAQDSFLREQCACFIASSLVQIPLFLALNTLSTLVVLSHLVPFLC